IFKTNYLIIHIHLHI
ncbi:hypothetical protein, partial [Plasmodium yoelii yoelii]